MKNREKCIKALHEFIDNMDDNQLFEFTSENDISSPDVYNCHLCEQEHGASECEEPNICMKRFKEWIQK